jgi:hypothetical protein
MGVDINGWMEVCENGNWEGIYNLSRLDRNYSAFAVLFGVRQINIFPVARCGKPEKLSPQMEAALDGYPSDLRCFVSWFLWSEMKKIKIVDMTISYPVYITELHRKTKNGLIFDGVKPVPDLIGGDDFETLMREGKFETHRYVYKATTVQEEFYLDEGWMKLFALAAENEEKYGAENIRFTAFFE